MTTQQNQPEHHTTDFCRVQTVLTPQLVQRLDAEAARRTCSRRLLLREGAELLLKQLEHQLEAA